MIDLIIAGGGPAGLATGLCAARAGLSCVIVEPHRAPIDKACGEGLMPGAVRALAHLGLDVTGQPLRGIRYVCGSDTVTASFSSGDGRGIARTQLHAALSVAAQEAGVEFRRAHIEELQQGTEDVRVDGLRARYLVGADGLHSRVRHVAGLQREVRRSPRRWGIRAHLRLAPWTDHVEVHWGRTGEAYVTPLAPDLVGVAVLSGQRMSFADHVKDLPALRERLAGVPLAAPPRGAGPLRQDAISRVRGRVLLVGDAAGYVDALTGEGLAIAFSSAVALVERVIGGDVLRYEFDYRRISRRYRLITAALLQAAQRPSLRRHIVPAACRYPVLFQAAVDQLAR
ncbi:MAG TPA: NAD(P)/FAD-dependent oxidoreductase [Jatrophihabitans sp.]